MSRFWIQPVLQRLSAVHTALELELLECIQQQEPLWRCGFAVNNELEALDQLLQDFEAGCRTVNDDGWLNAGARVAVISFHSLEDRRVKHSFVALEKHGLAKRLTRKPICASNEEIASKRAISTSEASSIPFIARRLAVEGITRQHDSRKQTLNRHRLWTFNICRDARRRSFFDSIAT